MQYRHVSGFATPEVRKRSWIIATMQLATTNPARDVTTQRRGACLVAAIIWLAHELWAKMPLESGYGEASSSEALAAPLRSL